jgi:hypothetical protein
MKQGHQSICSNLYIYSNLFRKERFLLRLDNCIKIAACLVFAHLHDYIFSFLAHIQSTKSVCKILTLRICFYDH